MSEEEAMALPLKERPICFRISSEMYHAVFEAIGEASMCWNPTPGDSVFASEKASDVAARLCFKIANEVETKLESATSEHDRLVERSVGAMAIAEGDEDWQRIPVDCPMLEAVAKLRKEADDFTKHVGAPSFKEAVDVLFRTKQQDEDKIAEMFDKIKDLGSKLAKANKTIDELNEAAIDSVT